MMSRLRTRFIRVGLGTRLYIDVERGSSVQ